MSAPSGDPVIGHLLDGRYVVQSPIARGGMATVYRALDTRLDRVVAVKVMHPHLAEDDGFAARFVREARSAARLSHPGVVGVFDQGEDDGRVYLAMEYVPGRTLRDVVTDEAPLAPLRAVLLMERVVDALAAAHAARIVHRDVKPENVLIGPAGEVKVADFGLARAISTESTATTTGGLLIGTVSYLAPELVLGDNADARSDVYAAGVVLYELLTGAKPHRGDTPIQVAYRHVNTDVPAPSAHQPGSDWHIPDFLDALVARATTRDPALRPTDGGVLLRQLRRVRSALEQGVLDDPDLADDLRPRPGRGEDTPPYPLLEPAPAGSPMPAPAPDRHEHTLVVGAVATAEPPATASAVPAVPGRTVRGAPSASRRRRGMWWLVLVLVLALLAGFGGWWYGVGRFTATPRLVTMTEQQARDTATRAGLDVTVGATAYSERVPAGSVVTTDPAPGDTILRSGTITLTLSKGKERYAVPVLAGMTVAQAHDELVAGHLSLGRRQHRWDAHARKGTVIESQLPTGRMLKPGTAVTVVVSLGPKPVPIDDVRGQPVAEARAALAGAGFGVTVAARAFSDSVPAGSVLAQHPHGGTGFHGDRIELVVSKGPQLVEVPALLGATAADAESQLDGLGLAYDEVRFFSDSDTVVRQDPGGGEQVPPGTMVTLYLV